MDLLALPSPCLLRIGEKTLVFSISARLAVIGSLPALMVWPKVIHKTGAGRVEGNPVRAHSFTSISPSAAFHQNWSITLQCAGGSYLGDQLHLCFISSTCFHHEFDSICSLVLFMAAGDRLS